MSKDPGTSSNPDSDPAEERPGASGPSAPAPPSLRRTALYDEHLAAGATLIDFGGWEMPVRYGKIPEEHLHVRSAAGLFDLGHMGRLLLRGQDAEAWVQRLVTNDVVTMAPGQARYTLITNDAGSIIDDAIVYKLPPVAGAHAEAGAPVEAGARAGAGILLVVNASNREAVVEWIEAHPATGDAACEDLTTSWGMVAIQGQESVPILSQVLDGARVRQALDAMPYYSIAAATFSDRHVWVARTGYTGEDGFEVYVEDRDTHSLWRRLLEVGGETLRPIGLGARDTLRLEAGMPLYGHEIDQRTDPFSARLGFAVKLEKPGGFIGCEALAGKKAEPSAHRLEGFRLQGRRVPRAGMTLHLGESEVGWITSGAPSPTLGYPIAMGYLSRTLPRDQLDGLELDVRGRREPIELHRLPFFSRTRKPKTEPDSKRDA